MKRTIVSLLAGASVCGFAWLGGYDFNTRGIEAFFAAYLSIAVAVFVYLCPRWKS